MLAWTKTYKTLVCTACSQRAFVCRLQASPVYASITISCLKPQTAYGWAVQSRKTVKTESRVKLAWTMLRCILFYRNWKTVKKRRQSQACLNRRQDESHQACLNGRGAKEEDQVNGRGAKEEERSSTMLRCILLCSSVLCANGFLAIAGFFFCSGIIQYGWCYGCRLLSVSWLTRKSL